MGHPRSKRRGGKPARFNDLHWPTPVQLEQAGFVRCKRHADGCTTWIDPVNMPHGFCLAHAAEHRRERRARNATEARQPRRSP